VCALELGHALTAQFYANIQTVCFCIKLFAFTFLSIRL
jgi:hypothetical protein